MKWWPIVVTPDSEAHIVIIFCQSSKKLHTVREMSIAGYAITLSGLVLLNVIPLRGNMTYIRVQILEPLYNQSNRAFTNEVLDWN